jgi:hypothetical protein
LWRQAASRVPQASGHRRLSPESALLWWALLPIPIIYYKNNLCSILQGLARRGAGPSPTRGPGRACPGRRLSTPTPGRATLPPAVGHAPWGRASRGHLRDQRAHTMDARAPPGLTRRAQVPQSQPTPLVPALMGTARQRGVNPTRASGRRWPQGGWHGRERLGRRGRLGPGGPRRLVGATGTRLGLLGVLTRWWGGRGWSLRHRNAAARPGRVQHDKQPQKSQDQELRV